MGFLDAFYPQSFTENLLVMLVQEVNVHGARLGATGEQERGAERQGGAALKKVCDHVQC